MGVNCSAFTSPSWSADPVSSSTSHDLPDALHPCADQRNDCPPRRGGRVAMPERAEHIPRLYTAARGLRVSAGTLERLT